MWRGKSCCVANSKSSVHNLDVRSWGVFEVSPDSLWIASLFFLARTDCCPIPSSSSSSEKMLISPEEISCILWTFSKIWWNCQLNSNMDKWHLSYMGFTVNTSLQLRLSTSVLGFFATRPLGAPLSCFSVSSVCKMFNICEHLQESSKFHAIFEISWFVWSLI